MPHMLVPALLWDVIIIFHFMVMEYKRARRIIDNKGYAEYIEINAVMVH